jgi:CRISPR/Cas system-associated exonuclease Cas4 (RecB family)
MSLTNKDKAQSLRRKELDKKTQADMYNEGLQGQLSRDFQAQLDEFHRKNVRQDYALDKQFLLDEIHQLEDDNLDGEWDDKLITFSPSGASACERNLFFKIIGVEEDPEHREPYQTRWTRNGRAVHRAFQSDLVYMEKYLDNPLFRVKRTPEGRFAWERNVRRVRTFTHNGQTFQIYGMTDGFLEYKSGDIEMTVGVDLKTKSTTVAAVGDYLLKVPQESNVQQFTGYALLFDVDYWIVPYESLAKDAWSKGKEAKPDMKTFTVHITEEMKLALLDKYAEITRHYNEELIPAPNFEKCQFCTYKTTCAALEGEMRGE